MNMHLHQPIALLLMGALPLACAGIPPLSPKDRTA